MRSAQNGRASSRIQTGHVGEAALTDVISDLTVGEGDYGAATQNLFDIDVRAGMQRAF